MRAQAQHTGNHHCLCITRQVPPWSSAFICIKPASDQRYSLEPVPNVYYHIITEMKGLDTLGNLLCLLLLSIDDARASGHSQVPPSPIQLRDEPKDTPPASASPVSSASQVPEFRTPHLPSGSFSESNYNYGRDQQALVDAVRLLSNLNSHLAIPFSAMTNVGLEFPYVLSIDPTSLALIPPGYQFVGPCGDACDTWDNHLVEINLTRIAVVCEMDNGPENIARPWQKVCPSRQKTMLDFLMDLTSRGNRIAVSKSAITDADRLDLSQFRCSPVGCLQVGISDFAWD